MDRVREKGFWSVGECQSSAQPLLCPGHSFLQRCLELGEECEDLKRLVKPSRSRPITSQADSCCSSKVKQCVCVITMNSINFQTTKRMNTIKTINMSVVHLRILLSRALPTTARCVCVCCIIPHVYIYIYIYIYYVCMYVGICVVILMKQN